MDTTPFKKVSYAGLVFFLVVSVIFRKSSSERMKWPDYFEKLASRLMIPWAAWFLIYGLLNLLKGKDMFPHTSGLLQDIVGGPWIGLWYLPFSLASSALIYKLVRFMPARPPSAQFALYLMACISALVLVSRIRTLEVMVAPWAQWFHAAPSIPVGLTLAYILDQMPASTWMLAVYQACLLVVCALLYPGDPGMALSYGIGSLLVTTGFLFNRRMPRQVGQVSSLCLGVYLVHCAVMSGFKLIPWITQYYVTWFLLTTLASFMLVAFMRRMPLLARIV